MLQTLGKMFGIAEGKQDTDTFDHFLRPAAGRGQQGHAGRHGFQQHHAERLMVGAQGKHIKGPEIPASLRHLAEEQHLVGDVQLMRQVLEVLLQAPAAEDRQAAFGRQVRQRQGKALEQRGLVFVRMQATDIADHPFARRQPQRSARLVHGHLAGLHGLDVDTVIQGLDTCRRPR